MLSMEVVYLDVIFDVLLLVGCNISWIVGDGFD
jgi:hypothetical protein